MVLNELVIGDVFIVNDNVVIGVTFKDIKSKEEGAKMDISFFADLWKGKDLEISGNEYTIKANILDVNVKSSITEFKNIFFLTDLKSKEDININNYVVVL